MSSTQSGGEQASVKVGVIGCGNISGAYFKTNQNFNFFDIVACADLDVERAKANAERAGHGAFCGRVERDGAVVVG